MSIKVNNVSFSYLIKTPNEVKALDDVSFEIKDHSVTAIIGHTGSGKSTLIQLFNALMIPTSGTIEVDDFTICNKPRKNNNIKQLRQHIASIFQFPEYQLFEETVEKDVAFGLKNYGVKEPEAIKKAHEALKLVGIGESFYKRSPFELSGGEKRRVAIAGILVLNPDILIMDEPTAGLDPEGTRIVLNLIDNLNRQGKTIILVTHDMNIVLKHATDVIVLKEGKVAFDGKPQELFSLANDNLSLDIPPLFVLSKALVDKGYPIDISKIQSLDDLMNQLKGGKNG